MKPISVTLLLCSVEILGLSGMASFSALLPLFLDAWELTNTQAGWLNAIYYMGAGCAMGPIALFGLKKQGRGRRG